jgi:hypothetical protein
VVRPEPLNPRWVAEQFARATVEAGTTCRLWLTWEFGSFCWYWQPERPTGRSARAYTEVAELDPDAAYTITDSSTVGWWATSHMALKIQGAMDRARGFV